MDSRITLSISSSRQERKSMAYMQYGGLLLAGLEKTYILLATFPWLELSLWPCLTVRSQEETGLTLCPREREFWVWVSIKFGKLHQSLGNSPLGYVPSKQRGGGSHHVSETSLHLLRMTLVINVSSSCSPPCTRH